MNKSEAKIWAKAIFYKAVVPTILWTLGILVAFAFIVGFLLIVHHFMGDGVTVAFLFLIICSPMFYLAFDMLFGEAVKNEVKRVKEERQRVIDRLKF